jgi:hypothetical protein
MGITRVCSILKKEPCFGLLRRNDRWEQVQVIDCITEPHGVIKNTVTCPDGTRLVVANSLLRFDGRIKRFVPYPNAKTG